MTEELAWRTDVQPAAEPANGATSAACLPELSAVSFAGLCEGVGNRGNRCRRYSVTFAGFRARALLRA